MGQFGLGVLLHNIRSVENVGSILRTADGFGVDFVISSGWTALAGDELPHVRERLLERIGKTALGAEKMVNFYGVGRDFSGVKAEILRLKEQGYYVVGLENNIDKNTEMVYNIRMELFSRGISKILLVLGEEVEGICPELMDMVDIFVEIPMQGEKESFNVAIAAGIFMYEIKGRGEQG